MTKKNSKRLKLAGYFFGLLFASGFLFWLAVGFTEPFKLLVSKLNSNEPKKFGDWLGFAMWALWAGVLWGFGYLCLKYCEKGFLGLVSKPKPQKILISQHNT